MPQVRDIIRLVEEIAPPALAESWDNPGLLVGSEGQEVKTALCAVDASLEVVEEAKRIGAELIISHHPLMFSGAKRITDEGEGPVLRELIKGGIALYAAHTNLDRAKGGTNDCLAGALGIKNAVPLEPNYESGCKIVVFTPRGYEDAVIDAAAGAGAGIIGDYSRCAFLAPGEGTYIPGEGANPFIGKVGGVEKADELRIEMNVPAGIVSHVVAAVMSAHPYEEPAMDVYPLAPRPAGTGFGRIGTLETEMRFGDFCALAAQKLGRGLRIVGKYDKIISKVAVWAGACGEKTLETAQKAGADIFVCGEIKHHLFVAAANANICVIEAGHFKSERPGIMGLIGGLQFRLNGLKYDVKIVASEVETVSEFWE